MNAIEITVVRLSERLGCDYRLVCKLVEAALPAADASLLAGRVSLADDSYWELVELIAGNDYVCNHAEVVDYASDADCRRDMRARGAI